MSEHHHTWTVYSTVIEDCCILVRCDCGARGSIDNPSFAEWSAAFHAPSKPYPWLDDERVSVDVEQREANAAALTGSMPSVPKVDLT